MTEHRTIRAGALDGATCRRLLASLVVPRPIAWVSTRSAAGVANLAPFSSFMVLAADPPLLGIAIAPRDGGPKDTLANIRATSAFCVNVVTKAHLRQMQETALPWAPEVDELAAVGLASGEATTVDAPCVADAVAVLECRLCREVPLAPASGTLLIAEVLAFRLAAAHAEGDMDDDALLVAAVPVGHVGLDAYALVREVVRARPGKAEAREGQR